MESFRYIKRQDNIFLASEFCKVADLFPKMLRKPAGETSLVVVPTAAKVALDPLPVENEVVSSERWESVEWVKNSIDAFKNLGFRDIKIVDVEGKDREQLAEELGSPDVLFVAGGNPFALARGSFSDYVCEHIRNKKIYVGSSAGSVLLGDLTGINNLAPLEELHKLSSFTDKEFEDKAWQKGTGLIGATIVPHFGEGDEEDRDRVRELVGECFANGVPVIRLSDEEVLSGFVKRRLRIGGRTKEEIFYRRISNPCPVDLRAKPSSGSFSKTHDQKFGHVLWHTRWVL